MIYFLLFINNLPYVHSNLPESIYNSSCHKEKHVRNVQYEYKIFNVSWYIDYGYRLSLDNGTQDSIIPTFASDKIYQEFNRFFSPENLKFYIGRKLYCKCKGIFKEDSTAFYIVEAKLFAK